MLHHEAEKMGVMYDFVQSVYLSVNWEGTVKICALYPIFCFVFHETVSLLGNWLVSQV